MKPGKIVLIILGFIGLCLVYYCLFPKYEMGLAGGGIPMRINRITGEVDAPDLSVGGGNGKGVVFLKGRLF